MAPRRLGKSATAVAGLFRRRLVRWPLVSVFDLSPRRPGAISVEVTALSQLWPIASLTLGKQDQARLAPGSRTVPVSCPAAGPRLSHARQQDHARLAPGSRTVFVSRPMQQDESMEASLPRGPLVSDWGSGGSRVRWCRGLGCRGGGPGGGTMVLMGRARCSVLPSGHGRVDGVVAGVWRWVAMSIGRGENLLYLRMDRRRHGSFPS